VRVATAVSPGSCISCVVIHFTIMMSRRLFPHMPSPLPPPKPSTADAAAEQGRPGKNGGPVRNHRWGPTKLVD
jgi:hypothetical protein